MSTKLHNLRRLGVAFAVLLNACSGGDINFSAEGPTVPGFPSDPPALSSEAITTHGVIGGSGNITVNDVQYDANAATVSINGQVASLLDLKRGHVVTVQGRINSTGTSGTAQSISFDADLIGPVEDLDAASGRLIVMGQTVTADSNTTFADGIDPLTFAGLSVGTTIQVSGFRDAAGAIRATRIEFDVANTERQVIGRVASLDLANLLFMIDRLTVDYSSATVVDLPGGAPADGMSIKAIGMVSEGLLLVDRLVAAPVLDARAGQRVQIAGVITRYESQSNFDINASSASVDATTTFLNGDADDLALNAELVIDGDFASDGHITANRISFGRLVNDITTLVFGFSDFTEISVPTVFNVVVTQGSDFSVEVAVDEDVANRIEVTKADPMLTVALLPGDNTIDTLDAYITMPVLERIDLTGVVNARLEGFNQARMTVNVGGVSRLYGIALMIDEVTARVSGVSQLGFGDIRPISQASVDISGVSQATFNMDVGSTLTGSVSTGVGTGISTLFYYGTNVNLDVTASSNSAVVRLGATKP